MGVSRSSAPLLLLLLRWTSLLFALLAALTSVADARSITRHYNFNVKYHKVRRLCHTKTVLTVNGKFPGQPIVTREGDRLLIKVTNEVRNNVSFHWHGVRQLQSGWADGPAYITQCPIQTNNSYVYNFTVNSQRGTLWWHAHISWLRATMYGPIIILPRMNESYPFPKPHKEVTIMLGEWWNNDTQAVIAQALQSGAGPNTSDAYTFNGFPGPTYNSCSDPNDTYKLKVQPGKTYLLRIINAALNDELFFSISNHTFTIVETDASYTKPFTTSTLLITPGQTTNLLLKTKHNPSTSTYLMAIRPYFSGSTGTFDNTTSIAFLQYYKNATPLPTPPSLRSNATLTAMLPLLPAVNDTSFANNFTATLRSLNSLKFPTKVPQTVDQHFFFTVGLGTNPCPNNKTNCQGPTNTTKFSASINNVSFTLPSTALLPTYYKNRMSSSSPSNTLGGHVFTTDFPSMPLHKFNYTGTSPNNTNVINGTTTKIQVLKFNTSVELVLQDTSIITNESHPLHLHGYNVFIVGQGMGNFDSNKDPLKYNLVDPVERNTVPVPAGGWVAVRFMADNPGVWFMHCHIEVHLSWGLTMAWLVLDGDKSNQKLLPPPADLPKC